MLNNTSPSTIVLCESSQFISLRLWLVEYPQRICRPLCVESLLGRLGPFLLYKCYNISHYNEMLFQVLRATTHRVFFLVDHMLWVRLASFLFSLVCLHLANLSH